MSADAASLRSAVSPLVLERPGAWRWPVIIVLFLVAIAPMLPLLTETVTTEAADRLFMATLRNSAGVALMAALAAFVLGVPLGIVLRLYDFTGRRILLVMLALPVLLPPFLLALGWTMLAGPRLTGFAGTVLVFGLWAMPLVVFAAYAAGSGLSATAIEAARLAGGEGRVMTLTARYVSVPALAAAGLGAALSIADPGPGQVFRLPTAASEILTSFAALNDFGLAARQSLLTAAAIAAGALPLAWITAPRMAAALMARETRRPGRQPLYGRAAMAAVALEVLAMAVVLLPVAGLAAPLAHSLVEGGGLGWFARAISEAARTAGNTLIYAAGTGLVATLLGFSLALAVGRDRSKRRLAVAACLALLCLPPALAALGVVRMTTAAPAWADPLLRGRFALCLVLGLRLFPVAAVFALRSWASSAPSWTHAAAIQGVPLSRYLRRVLVPHLLPAMAAAFLLGALLAIADIGTALLLHPPGAASFPLAIFTVMANAPEALAAALALLYVGIAATLLLAAWHIVERRRR